MLTKTGGRSWPPRRCPGQPVPETLLQRRCENLVAAEIARLSRRVPTLHEEHLRHVESALSQVIDRLMLSRASTISGDDLTVLFDLEDVR